ncbi:MAG TPA: sulfatase-like hydrolase/transferase, partial [Acidimicrobiales bacterium]|nr:sulfatase-like hydrolase/transferase [Acidimicrobiales bacterium]
LPEGDPRLRTYEGVLPGFRPVVNDPWENGGVEWGKWLAAQGFDVPSRPMDLYAPDTSFPGAADRAATWAPTLFPAHLSETVFMTDKVLEHLERHGDTSFFVHLSYVRPHPPRRNPAGYHDLYDEGAIGPFAGAATPSEQARSHPLDAALLSLPLTACPPGERERRQLRATYYGAMSEVDDQLGRLFAWLSTSGLTRETLVVLTSDHGEMGGDYWLVEKCGYWDESFHVPLVVVDPTSAADATRGLVVRRPTESVDVCATILDWLGLDVPRQVDGLSLMPFVQSTGGPQEWREVAHWEWDFRHVEQRWAEQYFGIPSEQCSLAVERGASAKYVQFAADPQILAPIMFDLGPGTSAPVPVEGEQALAMAQEMLRWRARNLERTLTDCYLSPASGPVWYTGSARGGANRRPRASLT